MSIRLLQLLLSCNVREVEEREGLHALCSLGNERQRWLIRQTHHLCVCAGTLPTEQSRKATPTCSHLHAYNRVHWKKPSCTGGAWYEVYSRHQKDTSDISDCSQMMMHRDLLPLQRQNKRTDMKEKSINIRRLIKHAFFGWIHYKGLTVFCLTQHYKKKNGKCWVTWLAAMLSFSSEYLKIWQKDF